MSRRSQVNYWDSRGAFGCWIAGKQVILAVGPNDKDVDGPTYRLACEEKKRREFGAIFGPTLKELSGAYLEWHATCRKPATTNTASQRLDVVNRDLGHVHATQLTALKLELWAAEQRKKRGWSDGTVRLTLQTVRACVRFGVKARLIDKHCLDDMTLPDDHSRGLEYVLTPEQERDVFNSATSHARQLLTVLRDTGCRPGEASQAEARFYNGGIPALVYPPTARDGKTHKNARKTKKPRVIRLVGESLVLIERLCEKYPTGPLLRTAYVVQDGEHKGERRGWTNARITDLFYHLRQRTGMKDLIAYSFRHTYAVRALRAGVLVQDLAELMGTSVEMIEKTYGHLSEQHDYLNRVAARVESARHMTPPHSTGNVSPKGEEG